jgi:aspartate/methionine/tyrosine aminotransferase
MPGVSHFSALRRESDLVHVVYGFAKDFGLSGFKVGVLHSENREVIKAVQDSTYFYSVSTETQRTLTNLLDSSELKGFFNSMREGLAAAYRDTASDLAAHGIPFLPVEGGIVVWLDLRAFLDSISFEAERDLFEHMFEQGRVNISPGKVFHCAEPGWFRLCFTVPESHRREGLKRLINGVT